jgi:hypothetical protein
MTPAVEQLVRETMEMTGAAGPSLMEEDAPVLSPESLSYADRPFYLVGLIGGKDVGKSMLVNALAGRNISASSAYGPGTESVVAYAHVTQETVLRELLEREVPGQFRIVTHERPNLKRQILLDLPDIDSHFAEHVAVTRKMLRHMLFPIWLVSVEKYADQQPQQMLKKVAAGNAPTNFIFCLNKIDQLAKLKGVDQPAQTEDGMPPAPPPEMVAELRNDYACRLKETLSLPAAPQVYMISAMYPEAYEFPAFRNVLQIERSPEAIRESQRLAALRQDKSLLAWLDHQKLPQQAQRLARLEQDAQEMLKQRIAEPLLTQVIPRLLADPATRGAMTDEIMNDSVARWPILRFIHVLLSPLFMVLRGATAANAAPLKSAEGQVEIAMNEAGYSATGLVQTSFAQLRQAQPAVAELYGQTKYWEPVEAERAAAELRRALGQTVQRQREAARRQLAPRSSRGATIRWLLTVGAVLWFPFMQPILQTILGTPDDVHWPIRRIIALVISLIGVNYLLSSVGFLAIYFAVLWLALRWHTQRRLAQFLASWQGASEADPTLSLTTQTMVWIKSLTVPLEEARKRMDSLVERAEAVRKTLTKAA